MDPPSGGVPVLLPGGFTTANRRLGPFSGPWKLSPAAVTSNGFAPPGWMLIPAPSSCEPTAPASTACR
jgi:hypothetical protein